MTSPTSVRLTPSERAALDDYASRVDRDRSYVVRQAVNEFLAQRASVTGGSRLRDLEAIANQHLGATPPMPIPDDGSPMPPSVGGDPSSASPSFGGPFGKGSADEALAKANSGRSNQADQARTHADHFARSGHRVGSGK